MSVGSADACGAATAASSPVSSEVANESVDPRDFAAVASVTDVGAIRVWDCDGAAGRKKEQL